MVSETASRRPLRVILSNFGFEKVYNFSRNVRQFVLVLHNKEGGRVPGLSADMRQPGIGHKFLIFRTKPELEFRERIRCFKEFVFDDFRFFW
jgi:hypothetical protein